MSQAGSIDINNWFPHSSKNLPPNRFVSVEAEQIPGL